MKQHSFKAVAWRRCGSVCPGTSLFALFVLALLFASAGLCLPLRVSQVALARSGVTAARGGDGDRFLDGRWRVVRMVREGKEVKHPADVKLIMEFRAADHTWSFIVKTPKKSHGESGTWRLDGSQLVTRSEGGTKLERIKVTVLGKDELELRKAKERLLLKRL